MKRMILLVASLCFSTLFSACNEITPHNPRENPLVGTKWILVCIFDVDTGRINEFEPNDCDSCYMLEFNTNNKVKGRIAYGSIMFAEYVADFNELTFQFTYLSRYSQGACEMYNFKIYTEVMPAIREFEFEESKLKLYYNGRTKYMLFRRA